MGRPSKYTQALADEICERILRPESLRNICKDEHIPEDRTVYRWLEENDAFRQQYARAKQLQADVIADEMQEIADDGRNDWMEVETKKGSYVSLNAEAVARSRLRIDQRKWYLSKLAPKKYGEKLDIEHSGNMDIKVTIGGSPA